MWHARVRTHSEEIKMMYDSIGVYVGVSSMIPGQGRGPGEALELPTLQFGLNCKRF